MLVKIFDTGKGKASSAINYLIGDKDHTGKIRSVKPEIIAGDAKITEQLIDSCTRELKYKSGVVAFGNHEKPTQEQIEKVIFNFEKSFFAGLKKDENFNILWVRHEDKGNTELHFLTPMTEISTGKRLNIHPPGKRNLEFFNSWVAINNQKLGFAQVVQDPLKKALSAFEAKVPKGQKRSKKSDLIHEVLEHSIRSGKIRNRDELCKFLESKNIKVFRKGADYISIGSDKKHVRLRGSIYSENANYQQILLESNKAQQPKFLNKEEFLQIASRLKNHISDRQQYNSSNYLEKKVPRFMRNALKSVQVNLKSNVVATKPAPVSKISTDTQKLEAISKVQAVKSGASNTSSGSTVEASPAPSTAFDAVMALQESVGNLQTAIDAAVADVATAKDPAQRANSQRRLAALQIQKMRLLERMAQAKKRQLNKPP